PMLLSGDSILRPRHAVDVAGVLAQLDALAPAHAADLATAEQLYRDLAFEHARLEQQANSLFGERKTHALGLAAEIERYITETFPRILAKAQTDAHRAAQLVISTGKILSLARGED